MDQKIQSYRFDNVEVDPQTFKVWRAGTLLPLEPKAFEVLLFLIRHRDRLVGKEELLDAVWKETFVTPNALTRVIAHLRRLLGDQAKEARYIETVKTRGYRFIAEVAVSDTPLPAVPLPPGEAIEGAVGDQPGITPQNHQTSRAPTEFVARAAPEFNKVEFNKVERPFFTRRLFTTPTFAILNASLAFALAITLAWLLWGVKLWDAGAERAVVLKTSQITATPGLDLFPAFSPDGGMIAYSSLRDGKFEIFTRQFAPGGKEIQITSDGAQNLQPAWSPDGHSIAYHSRSRGGIWVIPAFGGVAKQLVDFGGAPAWSPDGEWITFQSQAPADLGQAAFGAMPPSTIWIAPASGGTPRQLTRAGEPRGGHGAATWAPDGKRIVFVTYDIGLSEVWAVSPKGQGLTRLLYGKRHYFNPVFSPDGKYLYLSTAWGNFCLWRQRLSSITGLPEGEMTQIANTGAALARYLTIAPDGKRIAYSSLTMSNNIGSVRLNPDSNEAVGVPKLLTQDTSYRKNQHNFSPDGKTIAYNVWRMGGDDEVWLVDADGGNPRQITSEPGVVLGWFPASAQVALSRKKAAERQLLRVDVNTGAQTLVGAQYSDIMMGRLSPDGRKIAFNLETEGATNVWTYALADGAMRQLTHDREMMGFPCWSPDGQYVAVEMKRGDDTYIAFIPRDGGPHTQLTFERGQSWPGSWSPDSDKVAFAGQRDGVWNIWWVSRKTKAELQVTNYTKPNAYVRYPAWSPRGDQIVYEYAETTGNIWMMELK
jgi:Tol biopolymer transport system component/DNA-binding winged helix-turn-helix (wHTH) protein